MIIKRLESKFAKTGSTLYAGVNQSENMKERFLNPYMFLTNRQLRIYVYEYETNNSRIQKK